MASPPPPPPAPTTISALDDDLVREIFLHLPSVTTLARAAFTCRAFLRAVRSSPAFRRHFRELHAPPLLALFLTPYMRAVVPSAAGRGSFESAAFSDLLQDAAASSEWSTDSSTRYSNGHVLFGNRTTDQSASYNPHSQALNIYPKKKRCHGADYTYLEFHTLYPDGEEQRPSRVVCVHHGYSWASARVAVFSSHTMEWHILPETGSLMLLGDEFPTGTVVNGFVCWVHRAEGCVLALNTATFHFSRMYLPPPLRSPFARFMLGQTKDGKLCIISLRKWKLSVWLWTLDDDYGMERFLLHKMFSLHASVMEVTGCLEEDSVEVQLMTAINGFVYLSVVYCREPLSPEWLLSFCLETGKVNLLLKESRRLPFSVHPYIMINWPSSLIHNKDSETGVTGEISEDDGPMGTEETSPVLLTALHSFKETLIDDDNVNSVEINAFLLDDEKNSLVNRITTLESGLATARSHVLRKAVTPVTGKR